MNWKMQDTANIVMATWLTTLIIGAAEAAVMFDLNPNTRRRMTLLHEAATAAVVVKVIDACGKTIEVPLAVADQNPNGTWNVWGVDTYTGHPITWRSYTVQEHRVADYLMQATRDALRRTPLDHHTLD